MDKYRPFCGGFDFRWSIVLGRHSLLRNENTLHEKNELGVSPGGVDEIITSMYLQYVLTLTLSVE